MVRPHSRSQNSDTFGETLLEEVGHGYTVGRATEARGLQAKSVRQGTQDICFIVSVVPIGGVAGGGLIAWFAARADQNGLHLTATAESHRSGRGSATRATRAAPFIESNDEQAVAARLKIAAGQQRGNYGLQPGIERGRGRVVPIVGSVRRQPRKIGQRLVGQIGRELAEANDIGLVDVCKVLERVVAHNVIPAIHGTAAVDNTVSATRLDVVFPSLARVLHLQSNVVGRKRQGRGRLAVVIGKNLSCGERLIISDRRMGISTIGCGYSVLVRKRGQVRHGGAAKSLGIARVFANHNEDVSELRHRATACSAGDID